MISIKKITQPWQKKPVFLSSAQNQKNQFNWLTQPYHLSKQLKAATPNYRFVLEQESFQELKLENTGEVFLRESTHRDGEKILVWNRVIIPLKTYQIYQAEFKNLNNQPIGQTLLFNNPEVRRGPFEYTQVEAELPNGDIQLLLARRSVFHWRGHPFTIEEIFSPDLPTFQKSFLQSNQAIRLQQKLKDYFYLIRLHRPIPILLMLWPTLWALWLASNGIPKLKFILIFILGVFLMRSCGDILNDLTDRKFDGQVERTKYRPLATGRVTPKEAYLLTFIFLLFSFILVLFLNLFSIYLSFAALGLSIAYPWMKRVTYFPQLFLGFAYNFGILMAFAAVQNYLPWQAWYLWILSAIWTVAYDTFYALADLADDIQNNIKSTAVLWRSQSLNIIAGLQLFCALGLIYFGVLNHFNFMYYLSIALAVPFGIYQKYLIQKHLKIYTQTPSIKIPISPCLQAFNNNHWIGLLILLGISSQFL